MKYINQMQAFLLKLMRGEYELAKTFWLYGVVVTFVAAAVSFLFDNRINNLFFVLDSIFLAYLIILAIGVWHSAAQYKGKKYLGWLAKIFTILFCSFAVLSYLTHLFY